MGHYSEFYEEQAEQYAKEKAKRAERNKQAAIEELKNLGYTTDQIEEIFKQLQIQKILDNYKL